MDEREISNITSESGLIATLIHNPSFVFYSENLLPNHFTDKQNACMYLAISNLAQQSVETIDAYNIISSLESSEATRKLVDELRIAADEPERLARLDGVKKVSPLAAVRWTEVDCRRWCEENDLLSPIYATSTRGGCWFCHNQGVDQLRQLRHNYPDLWQLMLKWDADSVRTFLPNGHTIHDYDKRFQMEDNGHILPDKRFRWKMLDEESA